MISKEGLLKRIAIALSIVWMVTMLFYAGFSAHSIGFLGMGGVNMQPAGVLVKYWQMFFSRWLLYILPSIVLFFILWIFDKKFLYKHNNLNKKSVRTSISWICVTFIFGLSGFLFDHALYTCTKDDCYNYGDIQDVILAFIILQIPLFIYWLIAWTIKGNTIFRSKNEIQY